MAQSFLVAFLVVAPLFLLIALGFASVKTRLISAATGKGLSEYVFVMAIPALLFRTVATASMPNVDPSGYWIAYFCGLAVCWVLAAFIARRMGRDKVESAVIGFSAAQSNTVLIGIPLILAILGDAGKVPIVLLLIVHLPITMTVATFLIARGESGAQSGSKLLLSLARHPIVLGILCGVLWRLTGIALPQIVADMLKLIADTTGPCSLLALGMSMQSITFSGSRRLIGAVAVLKLVLHPLVVFLLATKVFALPPVWSVAAILFAACPTGINAFLLAERHKSGEAIASGAIAITTLAAIVTMTVAVALILPLVR